MSAAGVSEDATEALIAAVRRVVGIAEDMIYKCDAGDIATSMAFGVLALELKKYDAAREEGNK